MYDTNPKGKQMSNFYVGYEDGEHMYVEHHDTIFEALAEYYLAIKQRPTDYTIEVEVGECIDEELEPLEFYSFEED